MKPQLVTKGIVLTRIDYQEADRILTVLTPDAGKLRLIAKGVRRPKSKLAGGIELFAVNDLTVLPGQRELKTLISSRLHKAFSNIVTDINRTMLGYELLKSINKTTEDEPEESYFTLLQAGLAGLDDLEFPIDLLELWFNSQLLKINGHAPNLHTNTEGKSLVQDKTYLFDFDVMSFHEQNEGPYNANHIKLLRLTTSAASPALLKQVQQADVFSTELLTLTKNMLRQTT